MTEKLSKNQQELEGEVEKEGAERGRPRVWRRCLFNRSFQWRSESYSAESFEAQKEDRSCEWERRIAGGGLMVFVCEARGALRMVEKGITEFEVDVTMSTT